MDSRNKITPFWNRIPHFFRYGFLPLPLLLAGALMMGSYLLGGGLFNLVFYMVGIKYGAEILKRTMDGEMTPPPLTREVISENFQLPFKLIVVIFCYFFVIANLFNWLGLILGIPLYILGVLLLPAVVISLVISEEIGHALNPMNWIKIVTGIGWPYLSMALFLFLLNIINGQFAGAVISSFSEQWVGPFWLVLNTYFMAVIFHLMGYVLMQYHEQLGLPVPGALIAAEERLKSIDPITPLIRQYIADGNVSAATHEMYALLEKFPDDMELKRKLYIYMRMTGQYDKLKSFALRYFGTLIDQKRISEATTVYVESVERCDPFVPDTASDYLPILRELRRRRASKLGVTMVQGFHKRFPDDPLTPSLYLELAKTLSEDMQRDDLAKQALNYLVAKFPKHELASAVGQYLGLLNRLGNRDTNTRQETLASNSAQPG